MADPQGGEDRVASPPLADLQTVSLPPGTTSLLRQECYDLLATATVGRLAFVVDGWPVALPVNFRLDGDDVLVRTAAGSKLSGARGGARVVFEVDELDRLYRCGWSVLVHGTAEEVTDVATLAGAHPERLRSWSRGLKDHWIRISPVQVSGRRLGPAWAYPASPS